MGRKGQSALIPLRKKKKDLSIQGGERKKARERVSSGGEEMKEKLKAARESLLSPRYTKKSNGTDGERGEYAASSLQDREETAKRSRREPQSFY